MASVSDLVKDAFRQENLKAIGQVPTDPEIAEGVAIFNQLWKSLLGSDLGEKLGDWPVPPSPTSPVNANFPLQPMNMSLGSGTYPYPQQNYRLTTKLTQPQTVWLAQVPSDGARMALVNIGPGYDVQPLTIDANGRLIEGATQLVLNSATVTPLRWFYRADLSNWQRIVTLVATDESPLPDEFDAYWRCAIAIQLCPRYNKIPQDVTFMTAKDGLTTIVGRYQQDMPTANDPDNVWQMPYQGFGYGWGALPVSSY